MAKEMADTKTSRGNKDPKQRVSKQAMFTTFLLVSPSLLLAALSIWNGTIGTSVVAILVFIYQAIMIKNYIDKQETY